MKLILIFLAIVVFFYLSVSIWNAFQRRKGIVAAANKQQSCNSIDGTCCGQHPVCEKNLRSVSDKVEYFDDEELDAYAGMSPSEYSDETVEQFKEVLHSMYDKDKPAWIRSLQQRRVALPHQLKEELLQITGHLPVAKQDKE